MINLPPYLGRASIRFNRVASNQADLYLIIIVNLLYYLKNLYNEKLLGYTVCT